ncbi:alpha/beta hydrolase fold domain-containing protein [Nocardia mexicana]|uniref:Acetyl esterase/lipase n=1 Tax=Nocardia mexicana TaxID=279262 RepID=A0A370GJ33_9NOCA|nr:alpha/beta hydrolase [Nocardia mexicana]RDI43671.1 acetyl esterase/lipase [Nocardia mexicana]
MTSWRARAMIARMRLRRNKRFYAEPAVMRERLPEHQAPERSRPPRRVTDSYEVTRRVIDDHHLYTLAPVGGPTSPWHIFHMHGGGFVEAPEAHHWRFAARMVDRVGCTYSMPMYPLAPEHDHRSTIPMIEQAYTEVTGDVEPRNRIVFGDSAGGTLALTLARHLRERGQPQPAALALFSPWIDLATDDPLSLTLDDRDPELGVTGLKQAGRWYAGERALDDPEVSPAFADLSGLAPAVVFIGHRDILLPDARRIKELGDIAGMPVELHEYPAMPHNWIMKNIPEARRAVDELLDFLHTVEKGADHDRQNHR